MEEMFPPQKVTSVFSQVQGLKKDSGPLIPPSLLSAEWLRNVPKLSVKCPLDLNAKVQRQQRKRRQREKTGP